MGKRFASRIGTFILVAALTVATTSAAAQSGWLPRPDQVADANEQPLVGPVFGSLVINMPSNPPAALAEVDKALAKATNPTPFRGLLLFARSGILSEMDRDAEALTAIDQSITLLPRYAGPLVAGSKRYAYTDRPDRAADYVQRAIMVDALTVRVFDDQQISSIMLRLKESSDNRRARRLAVTLVENDWQEGDASTMSMIARMAAEQYLSDNKVDAARAIIPRVLDPDDTYAMLAQKSYQPLWSTIEQWAGPRLSNQWPVYLINMRDRWKSSARFDDGLDYANALLAANADAALVEEFLPALNRPLDAKKDYDVVYLAPKIAGALTRLGRSNEALALYEKLQIVWPLNSNASALNIGLNRAYLLQSLGRYDESLRAFDIALKAAKAFGSEVNSNAWRRSHASRACSLFQMGRASEAMTIALSINQLPAPNLADLYFCMDQPGKARELYLRDLKMDDLRSGVIMALQPTAIKWPAGSPMEKLQSQKRALAYDPTLLEAVEPYGRIMPYALEDSAPKALTK